MVAGEEFESPLAGMRHLGVDQVELEFSADFAVYAMDTKERIALRSDEDATAYGERLQQMGITPCALLTARDFSQGEMEESIAWLSRAIEMAHLMGAPAVRIDSAMKRERELTFEQRVDLFAQGLGGALERTPGLPTLLGIENHGFQGNNLAFQLNVYQRVGSDRLGATMDTGNFYWRGYPLSEVYGILRVLAPYTKHTHLKNIRYPEETREQTREAGWEYETYVAPLDEGDIDHGFVLQILDQAGYTGDICIEDESLGKFAAADERIAVLERDVAHVRDILDSLA